MYFIYSRALNNFNNEILHKANLLALKYFDTFEKAEEWLLKNGKKYTLDYENKNIKYKCGLLFKIVEQKNDECIEDLLYKVNTYYYVENTYTFTKNSYNLISEEIHNNNTFDYALNKIKLISFIDL